MENARWQDEAIEGVCAPSERFELVRGQSRVVVRDDDDGLGGIGAQFLFPGVASALVTWLITGGLSERTEELFERLGAVDVEAGVEKPRTIAAVGVACERLRDTDGITRAAIVLDLCGLVAQAEHDDFVIEIFGGDEIGEGIQAAAHLSHGRSHAHGIVDHPNDVDGKFFGLGFGGRGGTGAIGRNRWFLRGCIRDEPSVVVE